MPELAEVEYFRKIWDAGLKQKVTSVSLHRGKRVFRGSDTDRLVEKLTGAQLAASSSHGKQMLFAFSGGGWLGVHLGMSGQLSVEPADYEPGRHDHLVLAQKQQSLVFHDPRMFGRVRFDDSKDPPAWWRALPPAVTTPEFSAKLVREFLEGHPRLPLKAALLLQEGFPGIGNWMADEILWQSRLHPKRKAGEIDAEETRKIHRHTRHIATVSLETIGEDFSDPPKSWLLHYRWKKKGNCPRCQNVLHHATIGGRTTCWCAHCQPD